MNDKTPELKSVKLRPAIKYRDENGVEHTRTGENHSLIEQGLQKEFPNARKDEDGWLVDIVDGFTVQGTDEFLNRKEAAELLGQGSSITSEKLGIHRADDKE